MLESYMVILVEISILLYSTLTSTLTQKQIKNFISEFKGQQIKTTSKEKGLEHK